MAMMNFTARIPARVFGFPSERTVLGFVPQKCPSGCRFDTLDEEYSFNPELFEELRMWWECSNTREPLYLSGPAGCGKTSMVMQFLARVNAPAVTLTCRRRMDKYELIGQWGADPATKSLTWMDGPALIAWRTGAVLVINEMTSAPADVWVACNDLLEGDAIVVDRTGEVVPRHPNTRVIFTDNRPLGDGNETSQYLGRNAQDMSVLDRCWHILADFPSESEQVELVWKKTQALATGLDTKRAKAIVEHVVKFAIMLREAKNDSSYDPVYTLSNRGLLRFVSMLFAFAKAPVKVPNAVRKALGLALTNGLSAGAASGIQNSIEYDFSRISKLVMQKA